jgi:hypothetical protein
MSEQQTHTMTTSEFEQLNENGGGICRHCGDTTDSGCEPDAQNYPCDSCGYPEVFGVEEALIAGWLEFEASEDDEDDE